MERQNVTLSLPKAVLVQARHIAVDRGTSLSSLLARFIEQLVREEEAKKCAAQRIRERLAEGFDLGTGGVINVSREALHERGVR